MGERPERHYSNSLYGETLRKIAQRKIAIGDQIGEFIGPEFANPVANRNMVFADGSRVRVRRDLGGIDHITIHTPAVVAEDVKKIELEVEEHGRYYFAIQLWETSDLWGASDGRSCGYVITTINDSHELVFGTLVLYGAENTAADYTTIYANQADLWNPPTKDFKHLLGPNDEELNVKLGDYVYWELNSDGKWYLDTSTTTVTVPKPSPPYSPSSVITWGDTETQTLIMVEEETGVEVVAGDALYNTDITVQTHGPALCDGFNGVIHSVSTERKALADEYYILDKKHYCSRDGGDFACFFSINNWQFAFNSSEEAEITSVYNTYQHGPIFGVTASSGLYPTYEAAVASCPETRERARQAAIEWLDTDLANRIAYFGTSWDGTCSDIWLESYTEQFIEEPNCLVGVNISGWYCGSWSGGNYTATYGQIEWDATTESDSTSGPDTARMYVDAFGINIEVPMPYNNFSYETISHKFYDPENNARLGFFAGSASVQYYGETTGSHGADDPQCIFITYAVKGSEPRYYVSGTAAELHSSHTAYMDVVVNGKTYYTDGSCFWGEQIVVD